MPEAAARPRGPFASLMVYVWIVEWSTDVTKK